MRKKERKGFTLIELLTTIAVLSLVLIIAGVGVTKVLDKVEENEMNETMSTLKISSISYIEEFKTPDKYWFYYDESEINDPDNIEKKLDEKEYSCTTVGQLINKGILNKKIIGKKLNEGGSYKEINKNTSIVVNRNKNTKVILSEDIDFDVDECLQDSTTNVVFSVSEATGDNNYYKNGDKAKVYMKVTGQDGDDVNFSATKDTVKKQNGEYEGTVINISKKESSNPEYDYEVEINEDGLDIDVCITFTSIKGNTPTFCLNKDGYFNLLKVDYTSPVIELNNLYLTDTKFDLEAKNAKDNLTKTENIRYKLNYNNGTSIEKEGIGSVGYTIDDSSRVQSREVKLEVKDDAGNTSSITKTLNIADSTTKDVNTINNYYCSLKSGIVYSTEEEAKKNCNTTTPVTPTPSTTYYCAYNRKYYDFESTAKSKCIETKNGEKKYSCTSTSHTLNKSTKKCSYQETTNYERSGRCTYNFKCVNGIYTEAIQTCTDFGCDNNPGDKVISFTCTPEKVNSVAGQSCTTKSKVIQSCKNKCKGTETKTYNATCTCDISGKNCSNCTKTVQKTVTPITKYYCSQNGATYDNYDEAVSKCVKPDTGKTTSETKYECPINNTIKYNTEKEAQNACTNYCETGTYYNNACYKLS